MNPHSFITFILFIISTLFSIHAQEKPFSVEIRGGVNFSKMHSDYEVDGKTNYRFDVVVDRNLSSSIFLRSGLTFSAKNSDFSGGGFGDFNEDRYYDYLLFFSEVKARYLQLPVMVGLKHRFNNILVSASAGGYLGYGIAGSTKYLLVLGSTGISVDGTNLNELSETPTSTMSVSKFDFKTFEDIYKRIDGGLTASVGAEFKRFTFNAGYELGLVNFGRDGDNIKNRTFLLSLGYKVF
jgi:hypothetical protein